MTPGHPTPAAGTTGSPWDDPVVDAGFAAAYEDAPAADPGAPLAASLPPRGPVVTEQDLLDEQADLAARPLVSGGRRQRAPQPGRLSPARAVAGAGVSVAGVLLGIGTLLWVTDDPQAGPGPVVTDTAASAPLPSPVASLAPSPTASSAPSPAALPPLAAAPPAAPAPSPVTRAPSLVVPVTVLNNSRRTGLAERAAARFERGGWPVRLTGNFRGTIPVTTVYYDPGLEASARAFARRFEGIVRVRPRFPELPARGVVVVLTREFAA